MNKKVSRVTIISVFVVFAIAMVFVAYIITLTKNDNSVFFNKYNTVIKNELGVLINKQSLVDKELNEVINKNTYTLDNPYIKVNPYLINPLSALIIFSTDNEVSIDLYINDAYITSYNKNKKHIIAVYGLYANSKNIITLKTSDGISKDLEVQTTMYNNDLNDFDLSSVNEKKGTILIAGNLDKNISNLRGFDYNNNLTFYLDLDYISGFNILDDGIIVGYNSNSMLSNICLKLDYMGKILEITKNSDSIITESNIDLNGKYLFMPTTYYQNTTTNYKINNIANDDKKSEYSKVLISEITDKLLDAKEYDQNVNISYNGSYLTFDKFENLESLILIPFNKTTAYFYQITDKNSLNLDLSSNASLYGIDSEGNYYNLNTTIKYNE